MFFSLFCFVFNSDYRLTVTASCPMNLQYFPMDSQLCTIEIESCKYIRFNDGQKKTGGSINLSNFFFLPI